MRQGFKNGILRNKSGGLIGINLGSDFTAEHEWGIADIRRDFKMSDKGMGIEKRTAQCVPKEVFFQDEGVSTVLLFNAYDPMYGGKLDLRRFHLDLFGSEQVATAWDSKSFGIHAIGDNERKAVRQIYEALQTKDFAIWLGGGGVFENAGLVLAVVSHIPADQKQTMRDADVDSEKLLDTVTKTGIEKRLKDAGKRYFALSPRWRTKERTNFDVIFWLNPYEQDIHNYGWFTVEDLELWAQNKGPCMGGRNARKD